MFQTSDQKKAALAGGQGRRRLTSTEGVYLSWVEIPENVVLSVEPTEFTLAMITIEIPAAIRPYSIAVAPDSFFRNAKTLDM